VENISTTRLFTIKTYNPKFMNVAIITGAAGLIGSKSVAFFVDKFDLIIGIDKNLRQYFFGAEVSYAYSETNRIGDHIWYVSDVSKFKAHYPEWHWTYNIETTLTEMFNNFSKRL
jgi:cellulose synthase/poly-beta-1,6-N-acetylglucosamine synthase-like glycosyltransferase